MVDYPSGASSVTVLNTDTLLIQGEVTGLRIIFSITNTSTSGEIIYLSFGAPAISGSGQVLFPGQTYMEAIDARFTPYNGDVHAIATAATATVSISKRVMPVGI